MPAAPSLRFTALRASWQFSSATAASINVSYIALRRKVRRVPASSRRSGLVAVAPLGPQRSQVGYRCCCAWDSSSLLAPVFSSFSSFVPWFFGLSPQPHYRPSPLLRPLLTSPPLSCRRSPQVRCRIFPLVPPGSTLCVFMSLFFFFFL